MHASLEISDKRLFNLICTTLPVILMCILLTIYVVVKIQLSLHIPEVDASLLIDGLQKFIAPELIERRTFIILILSTPVITFTLLYFVNKYADNTDIGKKICYVTGQLLPVTLSIVLLYLLFNGEFTKAMLGQYSNPSVHIIRWYLFSSIITYILLFATTRSSFDRHYKHIGIAVLFTFGLINLGLLFSWRIISINSVTEDIAFFQHLDPIAYVISQTINGKRLLIDLPSQYGLYPALIKWVFNIVPVSIFSLTALFGTLQLISTLCVFFVGQKYIRSLYLQVIFGLILLMAVAGTATYLVDNVDHYFQYWPIRFIAPALSVLAISQYMQAPCLLRLFFCAQLSALSILWNFDTGFVVSLSILTYLILNFLYSAWQQFYLNRGRDTAYRSAIHTLAYVFVTLASVTAYFTLFISQADRQIDEGWLLGYQKLFYGLGYYMLPMPLSRDPWMAIVIVYILGISIFFASKMLSIASVKVDLIFYLSILGIGLFSYYQGRSHPLNLVNVVWPALLIVTIVIDIYLVRVTRFQNIFLALVAPALAIGALSLSAYTFLSNFPKILTDISLMYKKNKYVREGLIKSELEFIKKFSNSKTCGIFAKRQGLYHLETGLVSPVPGPSIVETILRKDRDLQLDTLINAPIECLFWGYGDSSIITMPDALLDVYQINAVSSSRTLLYLVPKM